LVTAVERVVRFSMDKATGKLSKAERAASDITEGERRAIAREAMRAAFEHLTGRVVMGLEEIKAKDPEAVKSITSIVVSGGVAANGYLRHM
jgi:N6-L-threonylcarbamoyladenine synthase